MAIFYSEAVETGSAVIRNPYDQTGSSQIGIEVFASSDTSVLPIPNPASGTAQIDIEYTSSRNRFESIQPPIDLTQTGSLTTTVSAVRTVRVTFSDLPADHFARAVIVVENIGRG